MCSIRNVHYSPTRQTDWPGSLVEHEPNAAIFWQHVNDHLITDARDDGYEVTVDPSISTNQLTATPS